MTGKWSVKPPPLDDPGWIPIKATLEARALEIGSERAAFELNHTLASGMLRSMCVNLSTGERERLESPFWREHKVDVIRAFGSVWAVDLFWKSEERVEGFDFYVWQPDLDRLFGGVQIEAPPSEPLRAIDRAKSVLHGLYPTKAQAPASLKQIASKVADECRDRNWPPPSKDTVQRALVELGYRPPRKGK